MNENSPQTTTEISVENWTYTPSGNVPMGFTVSAPAAVVTTDENFEITTVTLSFAGTAPSGQNDFSLDYSFSVPKGGNMVDLKISSDDTASVTAAGKTASSTLHSNGWSRTDWIPTTTATETQVSGTFATIGGPYDLTVTVIIVRSLSGKVYGVDLTPTITTRRIEGSHEITTATISISGNAPSGTFAFTASNSFEIPGGNWVEIAVSSDDSATVTAGPISATSTLHASATRTSEWIETPEASIPVSVSLTNGGGPFSINLTVTTKKALVEMYFLTEKLSAKDQITKNELSDSTAQEAFKNEKKISRVVFGYGEKVFLKFRTSETQTEVFPTVTFSNDTLVTKTGQDYTLKTIFPVNDIDLKKGTRHEIAVTMEDGFIIKKRYTIMRPRTEFAVEFSDGEYATLEDSHKDTGFPIDKALYELYKWKCFRVRVYPIDVSFSGLYVWEVGDNVTSTDSLIGFFLDELPKRCVHMPEAPTKLNDTNELADLASLKLTKDDYDAAKAYYEKNKAALEKSDINIESITISQTTLGGIIWNCPIRWSHTFPGIDDRTMEQCLHDGIPKNQNLPFEGEILPRKQEMTLFYTDYLSASELKERAPVEADISKTFGIGQ